MKKKKDSDCMEGGGEGGKLGGRAGKREGGRESCGLVSSSALLW